MLEKYPARELEEDEIPRLSDMAIFTKGRDDFWPDNIPWLEDAVPKPYFVKQMEAEREVAGSSK